MRLRLVVLCVLSLLVADRVFTPVGPLLVFVLLGYSLAFVVGLLSGAKSCHTHTVSTLALLVWAALWVFVKPGSNPGERLLDRYPSLGLAGFPAIVGSSYVFLKGWDAIRRAQRGVRVASPDVYLAQMTFFPSFAAGPIAGPEVFARALAPTRASLAEGANRILTGVAKIAVLAAFLESFAVLRGRWVAETTAGRGALSLWLGVYASALWLYLEFAGYSDLAIGTGLLLGVRLPENFDWPYLAASPSEFWQRWHMSFTAWLREHVLSVVSRFLVERGIGGTLALVLATCAVMVACALWHGPTLSFLVWGLYHGAIVSAHQVWATRARPWLAATALGPLLATRAYRALAVLATFHLVCVGWVLFLPLDASLAEHLTVLGRLVR